MPANEATPTASVTNQEKNQPGGNGKMVFCKGKRKEITKEECAHLSSMKKHRNKGPCPSCSSPFKGRRLVSTPPLRESFSRPSIFSENRKEEKGGNGKITAENGGIVLKYISLNEIIPNPDQPRKFFDEASLKGLEDGIKTNGQKQPINVFFDEEQKIFVIVDGERRFRAVKRSGQREILCLVVPKPKDNNSLFLWSLAANFNREGHSLLEEVKAVLRISCLGKSIADISSIVGKSQPWVYQRKAIGEKLNPKVLEMLSPELPENQRINLSTAFELCSIGSKEDQLRIAEEVIEKQLDIGSTRSLIEDEHRTGRISIEVKKSRRKKPSDRWKVVHSNLLSFLRFIGNNIKISEKELKRMLSNRSTQELRELMSNLSSIMAACSQFNITAKQVFEKKGGLPNA